MQEPGAQARFTFGGICDLRLRNAARARPKRLAKKGPGGRTEADESTTCVWPTGLLARLKGAWGEQHAESLSLGMRFSFLLRRVACNAYFLAWHGKDAEEELWYNALPQSHRVARHRMAQSTQYS